MALTYPKINFTNFNDASNGGTSWSKLVDLQAGVIANNPDLFIFDVTNDGNDVDRDTACQESIIRKLWTAKLGTKVIGITFGSYSMDNIASNTPTANNAALNDALVAICSYYGIPCIDYEQAVKVLVLDGATLSDYLVDTVHPSNLGHALANTLLTAELTNPMFDGIPQCSTFVAKDYLYGNGDYENTPVIRTGVDNDGETGTGWADDSTARVSSTANDTIAWTGTFQSFGLDFDNSSGVIQYSVDGGAYSSSVDLTTLTTNNCIWSGTRAAHTITIKVISGTVKILRFLSL